MICAIKLFLSLSLLLSTFFVATPAYAQDPQPPNGDGGWSEIVDADGNIRYDTLTDLGVVQQDASWMPDLPFIGGQATYHEYLTPSGDKVVVPSASTLFFMALNPEASGLNQANAALGDGIGVMETMLAGYLKPSDLTKSGYSNPSDFFQAVINGKADMWTFGGLSMIHFLTDLLSSSLADKNLYSMLLLYTQDDCSAAPGGCPPTPPVLPPAEVSCPAPFVQTGPIAISGGSGQGGKIAPPKPVVVGQDPERRGVDVQVSVRVPPVVYHFFVKVKHEEKSCAHATNAPGEGCPGHQGDTHYRTVLDVWYECVEHTQSYADHLASAQVSISLTQASRRWILTDLAQAYPGAHLIHPDFSFSFGGGSASWSQVIPKIQTADPGDYAVRVFVRTTGTPVSAPRSASAGLGQFPVALVRVSLIQGQ